MLEQFRIMAEKTDSAIRQCADLSLRIVELEKNGGDRLNAGLIDIGKRFDTMMVERIREFERRYETLTATVAAFTEAPAPHFGPEPHHHPPAPVKR
jgi:hypothetical protein